MPPARPDFAALLLCTVLASSGAAAECAPAAATASRVGQSIGLLYGADVPLRTVARGIRLWQRCDNYGTDFPHFVDGDKGSKTVEVRYADHQSDDGSCATFSGRTITLYYTTRAADGTTRSCGDLAANLAHELGHVLGLEDLQSRGQCVGEIMAPITELTLRHRSVSEHECRAAGDRWLTFHESGINTPGEHVYLERSPTEASPATAAGAP